MAMRYKRAMKKRIVLILISMVFITALVGCGDSDKGKDVVQQKNTYSVKLLEITNESIDYSNNLAGTLMPVEMATVVAQASGEIKQIMAQIGDKIQIGDELAVIDYEQPGLQLEQAKSGVALALGQLEAAKAAVAAAEANLDIVKVGATTEQRNQAKNSVAQAEAAYNKVKLDADRFEQLYKQGAISLSDFENVTLQLENAEKNYENAKEALSQVEKGATPEQVRAAEATLLQAKAGLTQAEAGYSNAKTVLQQAELGLSKTTLVASIDGVILDKNVNVGQLIGAGSPAFTIGEIDQLKVMLPIPDSQYNSWKVGQEINVELYNNVKIATVERVHPMASMGTGSISVEVIVDNKDHDWLPGQVIKASKVNGNEVGILVPVEAVVSFGDAPYVFRYVDGVAKKTVVELGNKIVNNKFHIVSGLNVGDKVVALGADKLFDGDLLQVEEGQ